MAEAHIRWVSFRWSAQVALIALVLTAGAIPVQAHDFTGVAGGFVSGFMHPLNGPDHMAAMVAVGLWGAVLGAPALWALPMLFPLIMALGGVLGILGVPLPLVEIGIAVSAILLGLMVALVVRPPLWVAAMIVAFFAIFHGHAHGSELPDAAHALGYSGGFVVATGLLHLFGISIGLVSSIPNGEYFVRGGGVIIALIGIYYLVV